VVFSDSELQQVFILGYRSRSDPSGGSARNGQYFAQQKDTVDSKVEQQVRALAAKYDEAINEHPVAIAALHTKDGVHARGGVQGRKK
jgi:hypothetical protein